MYFDPMYLIFLLPAILLALWAQFRVHNTYAHASRVPARIGISGAEAAASVLRAKGVTGVRIEQTPGHLSDHYDPSSKVLRLSPAVFSGSDLAALGIAAHEAGHAVQDMEKYSPLVIRNGIVPLAVAGSNLSYFFIFLGLMGLGFGFIITGIGLFSLVVLFQLINLPVEFNASTRAREILLSQGIITNSEEKEVSSVLDAAAMTYVAATITSLLTLIYYIARFARNR